MYRNEVKIIAIIYFLGTLAFLATKFVITRYLVIVSTWNYLQGCQLSRIWPVTHAIDKITYTFLKNHMHTHAILKK